VKREVEGSSPLSLVVTLLLSLTPLHRVLSLVCPELTLASPRSPCLPTTRDVPSSNEPDRAGQPGTIRQTR
jgi:hypothetical protein